MQEYWRDIKGYDGLYQVSNYGRIKSFIRYNDGRIIKQCIGRRYWKVILYKDKKEKCLFVHRIVAKAFIPNPLNKEQINHKDGNKLNNKVSNLEWCSREENMDHARANGLINSKKVLKIKNGVVVCKYDSAYQAAKMNKLSYPNIWYCLNGKQKTAGGYEWKYLD